MLVRVGPSGKVGVNKDLSSHDLEIEAWTDGRNVRFLDGAALQFYGHGEVYKTPAVTPFHVCPANVAGARSWLYASDKKLFLVQGTTHTELTRATGGDYSGVRNAWTSTLLSGLPILNAGNLTDPPQAWDLDPTHRFLTLPNWPAGWFAKSIRSYNNQLVALGLTKNGVSKPFTVAWSHGADPGSLPISWDGTDPTLDAGEVDLAEGYDAIQDGLQLRDTFVIYKEASIWRMDYIGGQFVERFSKVLGTSGALNRNCIVEVDGFHLVLTGSDVLTHDGQSATSVLDKISRRSLFQAIDADSVDKCFVFKNPFLNEVFVCYPESGATTCNVAMVWNYKDNTVAYRDIPNLNHANFGPVEAGLSQPWDGDDAPWDSDITAWNASEFTPDAARVLMASDTGKLFLLDSSTTFNGVQPTSYVERRGLTFGAPESRKLIKGVRPRIKGNPGEVVWVKVGTADDAYTDPVYQAAMPYVIGSQVACDCLVDGRYIALRVENQAAYQWRLDSYDVEVEVSGGW